MELLFTILVYALSFLIAFLAMKWYKNNNSMTFDANVKLPPCLSHLPIVGSLFFLPIRNLNTLPIYFTEKSKSLGNIFAFYMCNRYVIVLNGKKVLHEALIKHSINFSSRPMFYLNKTFNPRQTGIIEHPYNEHFKIHHRISLNILKHFGFGLGIMESRIKIEVEDLVQRICNQNNQPFNPAFELTAAVSNVISSIIFGKSWSKENPEFHEGLKLIRKLMDNTPNSAIINFFPILRFIPYFKRHMQNVSVVNGQFKSHIQNVLDRVLKDNEVENFCCLYMDEINKLKSNKLKTNQNGVDDDIFDREQLMNTIRDLYLAGTETTATTLLWLILSMANNQDVQKRVRDELDRMVGNKELPSLNDKPNLPLTEATILEVMRYKTLTPMALPHLTIKETVIDGILIPSNVTIMPNIYSAHMNPNDWDEPEKFNIDRFLNEDKTQVINHDLVIPFSLGKRSCLGEQLAKQELFLFASALVHKFEILPPKGVNEIIVQEKIGITVCPSAFEARLIKRE